MRAVLKRHVAALLARGLAEHEIVTRLCVPTRTSPDGVEEPNPELIVNPRTGNPYTQVTINRIKHELIADWQRKDVEKIGEHYAQLIAENYEARRKAWETGDLAATKAFLDQLAGWIGANAPSRVELNVGDIDSAIENELARLAGLAQAGDAGEAANEADADSDDGSSD